SSLKQGEKYPWLVRIYGKEIWEISSYAYPKVAISFGIITLYTPFAIIQFDSLPDGVLYQYNREPTRCHCRPEKRLGNRPDPAPRPCAERVAPRYRPARSARGCLYSWWE